MGEEDQLLPSFARVIRIYLATAKLGVARYIKDVKHELRNSIATEPQEDVLAVLDEEEAVSLETLGGERERSRKNDAVVADGTALQEAKS